MAVIRSGTTTDDATTEHNHRYASRGVLGRACQLVCQEPVSNQGVIEFRGIDMNTVEKEIAL
jgi:hypothetical protein